MSKFDLDKVVVTFGLQLVATFAGSVAALFFWRQVLQRALLVN